MRRRATKPPAAEGGKAATAGLNIREHILDRTIYLMGKAGTTDVPVRAIAREAGVNVAAVNYYFSSKEQMLAQMAERFTRGFDQVMRLLDAPELPPEQRLRRWSAEVMRYLADYPGILTLMERQIAAEPADAFGAALRAGMQRAVTQVTATLRDLIGTRDPQRLAFKLTLFVSTLAGPFPRRLERDHDRTDAHAPTRRAKFLDLLIQHLRA